LVICAHLDDESFGLGGMLLNMTESNPMDTKVISLCNGRDPENKIAREAAFTSIMSDLGCLYKIHKYDDLTLDKENYLNLVKIIQDEVDTFRPARVFTTSEHDIHRDHQIMAEATKLACRPLKKCSVKSLYQFKIPGPSNWDFNNSNFNVAFDISKYMSKKLEFCSRYESEVKAKDSYGPCSIKGIESCNHTDGMIFGYAFAELARLIYQRD